MGKVQEHRRAVKAKRQDKVSERQSSRDDRVDIEGVVEDCLPNTMFRVRVTDCAVELMKDRVLVGTLAGKMRLYRIQVMPGDLIKGFTSKYDLGKCKITYRVNKKADTVLEM